MMMFKVSWIFEVVWYSAREAFVKVKEKENPVELLILAVLENSQFLHRINYQT